MASIELCGGSYCIDAIEYCSHFISLYPTLCWCEAPLFTLTDTNKLLKFVRNESIHHRNWDREYWTPLTSLVNLSVQLSVSVSASVNTPLQQLYWFITFTLKSQTLKHFLQVSISSNIYWSTLFCYEVQTNRSFQKMFKAWSMISKVLYGRLSMSCFGSLRYLFSRSFCRSLLVSFDSSSRSSTALSYVLLQTCRYECKTSKYFTEETNTLTTYNTSYSIKMDNRAFLNSFSFFTRISWDSSLSFDKSSLLYCVSKLYKGPFKRNVWFFIFLLSLPSSSWQRKL